MHSRILKHYLNSNFFKIIMIQSSIIFDGRSMQKVMSAQYKSYRTDELEKYITVEYTFWNCISTTIDTFLTNQNLSAFYCTYIYQYSAFSSVIQLKSMNSSLLGIMYKIYKIKWPWIHIRRYCTCHLNSAPSVTPNFFPLDSSTHTSRSKASFFFVLGAF